MFLGYMPGRLEFEQEPENDAEVAIKDMIFNDDDSPTEIELKLALLDIYNYKLDKRKQRKGLIFDRNLIDFKKVITDKWLHDSYFLLLLPHYFSVTTD